MTYIYVDDERSPDVNVGDGTLAVCRTYKSAISRINTACDDKDDIILDLDHDLGGNKSGYDIAIYVVEHDIKLKGYKVHSMNPVGRFNIVSLMDRFGYARL